MVSKKLRCVPLLILVLLVGSASSVLADEGDEDPPVVCAILFHRPGCPYCEMTIEEILPPLQDQYGGQLVVHLADTSTPEGHELYGAANAQLAFEREVVPIMVVGDEVLIGGSEIPAGLQGLIEEGLAAGGVACSIEGVEVFPTFYHKTSVWETVGRDMPANAISIVVLIAMVIVQVRVVSDGRRILRGRKRTYLRLRKKGKDVALYERPSWWDWAMLAVCIVGLIAAGYLSYVEINLVEAECGPVGDCNAVQQSEYARLFGLIPIAVLGLAGYGVIVVVWIGEKLVHGRWVDWAGMALLGLALFGTGFSTYLTFLEPFVIGATCSWCLTSAVSMTLILLLVSRLGWEALARVRYHAPAIQPGDAD